MIECVKGEHRDANMKLRVAQLGEARKLLDIVRVVNGWHSIGVYAQTLFREVQDATSPHQP